MYQDAVTAGGGGVVEGEAAEYHIMYGHYGPLTPTTPPTTTTLKLGRAGTKEGALTSVTLAGGNALVPTTALVDAPALSTSSPCGAGGDATDELVGRTLAVTSEGLEVTGGGRGSPVDVGGMDAAALVTSMVAPEECQGGSRKVIVKLFNSNTFSLDIIAGGQEEEEEEEGVASHHMLARNGTLVHAKLSEGTLIPTQGQVEEGENDGDLGTTTAHVPHQPNEDEEEGALPCQVMWTCAYCSLILGTSEAMAAHQQVCAKALGNLPPLQTTTSQATVDALMSPLRSQEEATYHLKLEGAADGPEAATREEGATTETAEVVAVWVCAVCEEEFPHPRALGRHLPSHTVHQLAAALLQLATPHQKVRATMVAAGTHAATTTTTTTAPDPLSIVAVESPDWQNDRSETKLEEETVDNPGDTPPQTPPQEKPPARKARRKPGPKPQEKAERKRKYVRKKKGEDEEAAGEEIETDGQGKEYRTPTITTTVVTTTTTTTTQPAPSGPTGTGQGSRDPHHCEVCNKKLSSRGNLAKHLIRHRAKKPFECNICHATFNAKRDCKNHYLQHHTTERPNRCHICGKSYVDKSYLLAHMVFHQDQKAYSCELCGKKFNTSRCVTRHKKRHQEEKRFVCDVCFRPFAVKADLTSHKRKVHSKHQQGAARQQQQQQSLQSTQQTHLPLSTQPPPPPQQEQETQQVGKSKDLTEFLLPGVVASSHMLPEQLLPPDLSGGAGLGGTVTPKGGGIFISSDPLAVSSLIAGGDGDGGGGGGCSYGVTLTAPAGGGGSGGGAVAGGGGQPAYIMINSSSSSTEKGVATTTSGLSIMYTNAATLTQQVGDLDEIQQLSTSVGQSLVGGEGQLDLEAHLEGQHHTQDPNTATLPPGDGRMSSTHSGDLGLGDGEGGPGGALVGGEDGHNPPSSHDPNSGFPLELISQTYQLDLQRTQPTSTYLG